ncbi:hypothetical protein SDC9_156727 [bioreactor metagenome]|uniref:Uncharacterized protein n=1 Tax=bioreactor metagenome TaxID=1076179 RepID=A0A645F5H4_9ZZZZ
MLQAASQQPGALDADRLTVLVLALTDGDVGPGQRLIGARPTQAALLGGIEPAVLALRQGHDRIANHPVLQVVVLVRAVEDEQREIDIDLWGGQPHAVGGSHGGEHVSYELMQVFTELRNRPGRVSHHRLSPTSHA